MRSKLSVLEMECDEFDKTLQSVPRRQFIGQDYGGIQVTGMAYMDWMKDRISAASPMIDQLSGHLAELPASWGKPGEPGDAIQILRTVDAIVGCCRAFLNWGLDICAADAPVNLRRLSAALRGFTMSIIGDIKPLPDQLARVVEDARGGAHGIRQINLTFSKPPQFARYIAELEEVGKHPEWMAG